MIKCKRMNVEPSLFSSEMHLLIIENQNINKIPEITQDFFVADTCGVAYFMIVWK